MVGWMVRRAGRTGWRCAVWVASWPRATEMRQGFEERGHLRAGTRGNSPATRHGIWGAGGRSLLRYESSGRRPTPPPHGMTPATLQGLTASGIPVCARLRAPACGCCWMPSSSLLLHLPSRRLPARTPSPGATTQSHRRAAIREVERLSEARGTVALLGPSPVGRRGSPAPAKDCPTCLRATGPGHRGRLAGSVLGGGQRRAWDAGNQPSSPHSDIWRQEGVEPSKEEAEG